MEEARYTIRLYFLLTPYFIVFKLYHFYQSSTFEFTVRINDRFVCLCLFA